VIKKTFISCILIIGILSILASLAWSSSAKEESADRGKYVAEQGKIIPPEEIHIDSYIAQIDYQYPNPETEVGVTLHAGHRQVSIHGQEEVIQIGIQGRRETFEDVPPMNLAFVFDKSGSMCGKDKIAWVREAFETFIYRLREEDTISIVAFAETADVLLPATRLEEIGSRKILVERVRAVKPEGESALKTGIMAGYEQIKSRSRKGSINRLIFISDGLGEYDGILETADRFREEGINISTVGVGMDFNLELMSQLANRSGGSSRFMSNREKINEIFNTDLDRMVVPVAYELKMEMEFLQEVNIQNTWGYDHVIEARKIQYSLPTLHTRDYETILIQVMIPSGQTEGTRDFARFALTYRDRSGKKHTSGPHVMRLKYSDTTGSYTGFSNPMVLKAGTVLHIAQTLKVIGTLYYSSQEDSRAIYGLGRLVWQNRGVQETTHYEDVVNLEREEIQKTIRARKQRCLDMCITLKKEIHNTHLRLEQNIFEDELAIFEMYIKKLSQELGLPSEIVTRLLEDTEIFPTVTEASIEKQVSDMVDELMLELQTKKSGSVVFSGFTHGDDGASSLKRLIDGKVNKELKKISALSIVPEGELNSYLRERDLTRTDLMDTDAALRAVTELLADYLVGGMIIETPSSVILFARVINGRNETVDSVAQIILPLDDGVRLLLSR
jgi:Mg-chelatase subunit ChlD